MRWYMKKRRAAKLRKSEHKKESEQAKGKVFRTGVLAGSQP